MPVRCYGKIPIMLFSIEFCKVFISTIYLLSYYNNNVKIRNHIHQDALEFMRSDE
jgi:hypothetical protein